MILSHQQIQSMSAAEIVAKLQSSAPYPGCHPTRQLADADEKEILLCRKIDSAFKKEDHETVKSLCMEVIRYRTHTFGLEQEFPYVAQLLAETHKNTGTLDAFYSEQEQALATLLAAQQPVAGAAGLPHFPSTPDEIIIRNNLIAAAIVRGDYRGKRRHNQAIVELFAGNRVSNVAVVGQGEVGFSKCGQPMGSNYIGDCIVMVAYSPATGQSGMTHIDSSIGSESIQRDFLDQFPKDSPLDISLVGASRESGIRSSQNLMTIACRIKENPHIDIKAAYVWNAPPPAVIFDPKTQYLQHAVAIDSHPDQCLHTMLPDMTNNQSCLRLAFSLDGSDQREPFQLTARLIEKIRAFAANPAIREQVAHMEKGILIPATQEYEALKACHNANIKESNRLAALIEAERQKDGLAPLANDKIAAIVYRTPKIIGAYAKEKNAGLIKALMPQIEAAAARELQTSAQPAGWRHRTAERQAQNR